MAQVFLTAAATAASSTAAFTSATAGFTSLASAALTAGTSFIGSQIDNAIFGVPKTKRVGARLEELAVQTSTYGKPIPQVYGTMRVGGNVIWARPLKEVANTTTTSSGGKGGGGGAEQETTTFSYFATLAIAICEGPIQEVVRVWADAKIINPVADNYTLYKGTETQTADSTMESFLGSGEVPAHRGLAYVVIKDFPLADYGNRIPNFTFEVKKPALLADEDDDLLENMIKSMVMIPGSGEFVYDTTVQTKVPGVTSGSSFIQQGNKTRINQNNTSEKADALVALDQLEETCPNLEWVAPVVTWFGDDLDAGTCLIKPGVEYDSGAITEPDTWGVGSFTRSTAHLISTDTNGNPVYGGTPNDASVLRYLTELSNRGYSIMFYPMFFMDTANKPWRGRVTGSASDVANFFTKTDGYNAFIMHYANLVKDHVDAFVIGSELIGLTSVHDDTNTTYPAVDALVSLAASVKSVVGSGVKVTYAADWSEYHHDDDGYYNLDPLWASSNIDFIGIDAYFPLHDGKLNGDYDPQIAIDGWTSGEGYDWYYTDANRTTKANLDDKYAWKNIEWFWKNQHTNPGAGSPTAWVPESKKIWFTEYGFPSVDNAINQPNVFYDPSSSESFFPRFSEGRVDFRAQRQGLLGTEKFWADSEFLERLFVWTWDARPFSFWPDLENVWTDGDLWDTGHWVQGKIGLSSLAAIVADLSRQAGLSDADFDVTHLTDLVDGYVLNKQTTAREAIEQLQSAYFFDAVETDGKIVYVPRGGSSVATIVEEKLVPIERRERRETLHITRHQELDLPKKIDVLYINRSADYQTGTQRAQRGVSNSEDTATIEFPIVLPDQLAKNIADTTLYTRWLSRTQYRLELPLEYAALEPTDIITVTADGVDHTIRITKTDYGKPGVVSVHGVAEDVSTYDFYSTPAETITQTTPVTSPGETELALLDIPLLPGDDPNSGKLRAAATGLEPNWDGAVLYRSNDGGNNYNVLSQLQGAVIGNATSVLADGPTHVFDEANSVTVLLRNGELESTSQAAVLNGANAAVIGDEIIQFTTATLVEPNKYTLSGLLRGRMGTEHHTASHVLNDRFVLLNSAVTPFSTDNALIGLERHYKPVSIGNSLANTTAETFTYQAVGLKPYAPVHVTGTRDALAELTITWHRRTRVDGGWRDHVDVPLNEQSELYELEILDGSDVVRTFTGLTQPTATYTYAQQLADFGGFQLSVSVRVYQISAVVGRGVPASSIV